MRQFIKLIIFLMILVGINFIGSLVLNFDYIDLSIPVGFFGLILTSTNGSMSKFADSNARMDVHPGTGNVSEKEGNNNQLIRGKGLFFYASITYTVVAFIITFYYYKEYFF